jgi:hypothetical protein
LVNNPIDNMLGNPRNPLANSLAPMVADNSIRVASADVKPPEGVSSMRAGKAISYRPVAPMIDQS